MGGTGSDGIAVGSSIVFVLGSSGEAVHGNVVDAVAVGGVGGDNDDGDGCGDIGGIGGSSGIDGGNDIRSDSGGGSRDFCCC